VNEEEFRLLDEIEDTHWWFQGKRELLEVLLAPVAAGSRMLDLGCGTGGILRGWMERMRCVGVDRSPLALRICRSKGFRHVVRGDLQHPPFESGRFDALILMDVLEHIEDDLGFLVDAARLCAPDGCLVISVPAFQILWSRHDETFEHYRRYRAPQLRRLLERAGLAELRITYTNALVFPLAAPWRFLSQRLGVAPRHDFFTLPRWLNQLLVALYRLEAWLLRRTDLPFGLSVVAIARPGRPRDRT
jgi:SAM-dependent methyltransferase